MLYLRSALTVVGITLFAIAMMLLLFRSNNVNQALLSFQKNDLIQSQASLSQLHTKISDPEFLLYQSYISREKGDILESTDFLEKAVKKSSLQDPIYKEIIYNLCLNNYLLGDLESLGKRAQLIQKQKGKDPWNYLFIAIYMIQEGKDLHLAEKILSQTDKLHPLSPWMKTAFGKIFSPAWIHLQQARCIAEKHPLQARKMLEEPFSKTHSALESERLILLGITYLKEAKEKPVEAAFPYHKIALSYFHRAPIHHKTHTSTKKQILNFFSEHIHCLIEKQYYRNLPFYLSLLQQWEQKKEQRLIIEHLTEAIHTTIQEDNLCYAKELFSIIDRCIDDPAIKQQTALCFINSLLCLVKEQKTTQAAAWFNMIKRLATSDDFMQKSAKKTTKAILAQVNTLSSWTTTDQLLSLWQLMEKSKLSQQQFAEQLACLVIHKIEKDKEAVSLLQKCTQFFEKNSQATKKISQHLNEKIYLSFLAQDFSLFARLVQVRETIASTVYPIQKEKWETMFVKVEKMIDETQYEKAEKLLSLMEKIDPKETLIAEKKGSIFYQKGQYDDAYNSWKGNLYPKQHPIEKAVVEYISGNREEGLDTLLSQEKLNSLTKEVLLRLSIYHLSKHEPENALHWLTKANRSDQEIMVALALAAYQRKNFSCCRLLIEACGAEMQKVDQIQGLYLLAKTEQLSNQEYKKHLKKFVLDEGAKTTQLDLSLPFQQFLSSTLAIFKPCYLATELYQ